MYWYSKHVENTGWGGPKGHQHGPPPLQGCLPLTGDEWETFLDLHRFVC